MVIAWWLACSGSGPQRAEAPDEAASAAVVDALCKVTQTAKHTCRVDEGVAVIDDTLRVGVATYLDTIEKRFGIATLDGRVVISPEGRPAVTTRFREFGMSEDEARGKGAHLWAVVDGAAIVDWLVGAPLRPALQGLYSQRKQAVPATTVTIGERSAWPGWTRGEGIVEQLEHGVLTRAMAPHVPAEGVHMVDLRALTENGQMVFRCFVDGELVEALCASLPRTKFPVGVGWGLQQAWLWTPKADARREAKEPPTP